MTAFLPFLCAVELNASEHIFSAENVAVMSRIAPTEQNIIELVAEHTYRISIPDEVYMEWNTVRDVYDTVRDLYYF